MPDRHSPERPDFDRLADLLPREASGAARPGGGPRGGTAGTPPADELSERLAAVWADVVGAEVADNARPVQLRDGRLVVTTSSSAWAQTLQLMGPLVVARLNDRLGEGSVERAVFRHAGWDVFTALGAGTTAGHASEFAGASERSARRERKRPRRAEPDSAEPASVASPGELEGLSAEEKQALADLERLPLAPSVKETIREAMKAGFARARQDSGRW